MKILIKDISKLLVIGISATLMLSGCGKSAIKCDNSDAKDLIIEIAEPKIKNALWITLGGLSGGYALNKQNPGGMDEERKKAVEEVDKEYKKLNPSLINIRTDAMNDNLEKSECSADIGASNGYKAPIKYKLSKTSDGKLYAEVYGL